MASETGLDLLISNDLSCLCSVCLNPLVVGTAIIETRCKHMFHENCLNEAKGWKPQCPNCRAALANNIEDGLKEPLTIADPVLDFRNILKIRISSARDAVRYDEILLEKELCNRKWSWLANARREIERQGTRNDDNSD